jgi:hypothetical protein
MLPVVQAVGGVMRMKSAPSSTVAPSLRHSLAMAAMRSVSFTRQLAMLRRVVVPSAYSAITASVMAASGMWLQSRSMAFRGQAPRRMCRAFGVAGDVGAHEPGGFDKTDVALDRGQAHAFMVMPSVPGAGGRWRPAQ